MIDHSFAVIAYKDSPFLTECLESIIAQTVQSHIYITTSTPSTFISEIANKYGISVFVTDAKKGIAHDWNFGLSQAKTKYVTLAHQDDIYLPNYAEDCFTDAEKFNDTLICFTEYLETLTGLDRPKTTMLKMKSFLLLFFTLFKNDLQSKLWKKALLSVGCPICCPTVMFNRERLINFEFSKGYLIDLDWDAWYRITNLKGRFVFVPKVLLKHRIHLESATSSGLDANIRQTEDSEMFRRIWPNWIAEILAKQYAQSYKSNNL